MAAQPEVLRRLAERRDEIVASLRGPQPAAIVIVARGSSDYAAIFARYLLEAVSGRPVALAAPSLVTLYESAPAPRRLARRRHQPVGPHARDHDRARALSARPARARWR